MSAVSTEQSPLEVLTSIIKNVTSIHASTVMASEHNIIMDQDSSFSTLLSKLEDHQQDMVKNVLLTLHFLFPHELLPALDLLDRRLITCLHLNISASEGLSSETVQSADRMEVPEKTVPFNFYYVQSASAAAQNSLPSGHSSSTSRFRNAYSTVGTYYEVHLDSWNCSCPAFAFGSMKLLMIVTDSRTDTSSTKEGQHGGKRDSSDARSRHVGPDGMERSAGSQNTHAENKSKNWQFGGSAANTNSVVPICKHILAVVLANGIPGLFGNAMQSAEGTKEEVAGRAAGFGTK